MKRYRIPGILVAGVAFAAIAVTLTSCEQDEGVGKKVIVVGLDGLDPRLCERMMGEGQLPHLARMWKGNGYKPLGTSIPPQSPVAWSNFITGADPGVHGIFDFIHRDPSKQCAPYYSAAKTLESDEGWDVGAYKIPLPFWPFEHEPSKTVLTRHGTPFWDYLDEAGVPVQIYDIPAHYPPSAAKFGHVTCLSGMGVPDLLGGYGTYQYFSEDTLRERMEPYGGGKRSRLFFQDDSATAEIQGPRHTYLKKPFDTKVPFRVYRHPSEPWARIDIQGQEIVLREGEWSEWQRLDFELEMPSFLPNAHAKGICRFYVKEVRPDFRLYVSPINIDPSDPAGQVLTEPPEFLEGISDKLGLFYTSGFQEDHKALSNKVFTDEEYREQANYVLKERIELLQYALDHYKDGLLFFYFSSSDLQAHMFWWDGIQPHPIRTPSEARKYNEVVEELYRRLDRVVGEILERYGDEALVMVMSDHGFCNFQRQFNLNTWLRDNGYLQPSNCGSIIDPRRAPYVDWRSTRAYGLGLNGLYVNLRTRERDGIVDPVDRDALLEEISEKLLAVRDPLNGRPVVKHVYRTDEVYHGPQAVEAPDIIVGYYRDYRASWATTLGDIEDEVLTDNDAAWSADHCIAADEVPGVIFSNKPILRDDPTLIDMAPTILKAFEVDPPDDMKGGNLFQPRLQPDLSRGPSTSTNRVAVSQE